jgi:hypothetical protein
MRGTAVKKDHLLTFKLDPACGTQCHKLDFRANCLTLGLTEVLLITPNVYAIRTALRACNISTTDRE